MATGFVDEARITARAGDGAPGTASFHREKFKPKGGPDGGDGGHGGSVVLVADTDRGTLSEYRHRRLFRARSGERGGSNNKRGADAGDLRLPVPVGTVVRDAGTTEVLADLARAGAEYVVARGGRGGRGNASLASGVERNPNFAEQGEPGQEVALALELRLVADVGLLGLPNAGKSTLLRGISRAHPKVADYPFTTLEPGLGVVETGGEQRLVVADLPGLISGAAEGKGLGLRFLRHAERCSVLAAVVDLAGGDPSNDLATVVGEVEAYAPHMADRVRVVVGNKIDLNADEEVARAWALDRGMRFVAVSARDGVNLDDLKGMLAEEVARAHAERGEPESFAVFRPVEEDPILIERDDSGFRVRSQRVERMVSMTPLENPRAVRHLQRRLKALGVEAALVKEGIREGDEVFIGEISFEYFPEDR